MAKGVSQNLHKAKAAKQDEFYTQLVDIENELQYYQKHFEGKVIYCNCDDPKVSNFFLYFARNFWHLKLKKLICSCYRNTDPSHFSLGESDRGCFFEYEGRDSQGKELHALDEIGQFIPTIKSFEFKGDGDFRSKESIALLKKSDIVVTNPPFSLFREFVAQLVEYDKKFVIIGNKNALSYKEIFSLIRENQLWTGYRGFSGGMWFRSDYEGKTEKIVDGEKLINVASIWFTNLDIKKRHEVLEMYYSYAKTPEKYPKYDNYDAINVDKTTEIPFDYDGVMGVPLTFVDKYNPEQFEIVGQMATTKVDEFNFGYPFINGQKKYARLLIKQRAKK